MKPLTFEVYGGQDSIRHHLSNLSVAYTEQDFLNNFWGTRFTVQRPRGKGSTSKIEKLRVIFSNGAEKISRNRNSSPC